MSNPLLFSFIDSTTFPSDSLSVNSEDQNLIIQTPATAKYIVVSISGSLNSTFTATSISYTTPYVSDSDTSYFPISVALGIGLNTLSVTYYTVSPNATSEQKLAAQSPVKSVQLKLDQTSTVGFEAAPPSGFSVDQRALDARISWTPVNDASLLGYNFNLSDKSGGPYHRINSVPILSLDPEAPGDSPRVLFVVPLNSIQSSFKGESYDLATPFYATVTTLLKHSDGGIIESPMSLEFELRFLKFPADFASPIKRSETEIKTDLLKAIHSYDGAQDIKPGSIVQDVFTNPVATEITRAYQRLNFYYYASSLASLLKYEDENGDGIPDTVAQSPLRQQLMLSFHLASEEDVQAWIDAAFDRLASRYITPRQSSRKANGTLTFYTSKTPTSDFVIPQGTTASSDITASTQSSYITLETGQIAVNSLNSYYNSSLNRWEVKVKVEATSYGPEGNALAGTITSVSGLQGGLKVVNEFNVSGGREVETNLELGARLRNAFLAKDSGRRQGIQSWVTAVPGVYSCSVIGAGDPEMMRDFDVIRQKHVYGRVDVYIDSHTSSEKTQTMVLTPATLSTFDSGTSISFNSQLSNQSVYAFTILDARLSEDTPIYDIKFIQVNGSSYMTLQGWVLSSLSLGSAVVTIPHLATDPDPSSAPLDLKASFLYHPGYIFENQPVINVNSLTGDDTSDTVTLSDDAYIVSNQDPFGIGNSVKDTKALAFKASIRTHTEPVSFAKPVSVGEVVDMTYTTVLSGVVPLTTPNCSPVLINKFSPSSALTEGVHYTLSITSDQSLKITRNDNLDPSGSYVLTYYTYSTFPRKFKVEGEPLVFNGSTPSYLSHLGVDLDSASFSVTSDLAGNSVLTRGQHFKVLPFDALGSAQSDTSTPYDTEYWAAKSSLLTTIASTTNSMVQPIGLVNLDLSKTPDGSTVYIDYEYYENLTVKYSVDQAVRDVQVAIDNQRHITANILAKRCNYISVSIDLEITLAKNASPSEVEKNIRSNISSLFNKLEVGQGVPESEIIRLTKSVSGVSSIGVPLSRLSFSDGAMILQESLPLWALNQDLASSEPVYKSLTQPLYKSIANGGSKWQYVAVYENGLPLNRVFSKESLFATESGNEGLFFLEVDSSYRLNAYIKPNRRASQSTDINSYSHAITYYVYGDASTHDLPGANLSILTLDQLNLTFSQS